MESPTWADMLFGRNSNSVSFVIGSMNAPTSIRNEVLLTETDGKGQGGSDVESTTVVTGGPEGTCPRLKVLVSEDVTREVTCGVSVSISVVVVGDGTLESPNVTSILKAP